ncbi:flagellar hook-associated protein FlgK [Tabrizicola sp.]|uniref:flagellar hook-associated protein FlgK n=1 Tax=Tabrizicola sp. TaxID=2005166 RepID=UPI0035B24FB1
MSLSSALHIASSGLTVASLQTEVASRNIASANTPGFTRKNAETVTAATGEVRVGSVERSVDALLVRLERSGRSRLAAATTRADGIAAYAAHLGQPEDGYSPAATVEKLRTALVTLSAFPSQDAAQLRVISSAKDVTRNLSSLDASLKTVTREVDMNLRYDVASANEVMQQLAALNRTATSPMEAVAKSQLADRVSGLVDRLSEYMDIQTVTTTAGIISVYTSAGTELVVDDQTFDLAFDAATGRLSAGDVDLTPGATRRGLSGGSLAGLIDLRSTVLPQFGDQLDGLAAALIDGFQTANPMPDGRGLFTDAGAAYSPLQQKGLAARIAVNETLDPDLGGDPGGLQSGGTAGVPTGDSSRIDAMLSAFLQPVTVATGGLGTGLTLGALAPAVVGGQQAVRADAEAASETSRAASETVASARSNFEGVNIDDEMQKLLLVQRSYAANAKVLSAVTTMLDALLSAV